MLWRLATAAEHMGRLVEMERVAGFNSSLRGQFYSDHFGYDVPWRRVQ